MHKLPEAGVVEVVDVAVGLPPAQVIPQDLHTWVQHDSSVKGRRILELRVWNELRPVENIAGGEVRSHSSHQFAAGRKDREKYVGGLSWRNGSYYKLCYKCHPLPALGKGF